MRRVLIVVTVLAFLAVGVVLALRGRELVLRIPEAELRQRMEAALPITRTYLLVVEVTLANPRVELREGADRIHAGLDATLSLRLVGQQLPLGGAIDISGALRYEPGTGAFHVVEPQIEGVAVQGVPDRYAATVNQALNLALAAFYRDYPVYTLRRDDIRQSLAKLVLKSVLVEDRHLVVTLGW